jgi:hypothetical protein
MAAAGRAGRRKSFYQNSDVEKVTNSSLAPDLPNTLLLNSTDPIVA